MTDSELIDQAIAASQKAYSPYSKYKVGAALQAQDGTVYRGCNMENASYSMTICAERAAFTAAVSDGQREFKTIAIAASEAMPYPCGACLQVMAEFCGKDFIITTVLIDRPESMKQNTLGDLLQSPFSRKE